MLRAILCDDEPLAIDRMANLLNRTGRVEIAATAENGDGALAAIGQHQPEVAFLDIEMPGLDGFDVVEQLARSTRASPLIVFVTAYPQFAAHAFDSGAIDFLTKPVRLSRLEAAIDRVSRAIEDRSAHDRLQEIASQLEQLRDERDAHIHQPRQLWISHRKGMVRVDLDALVWVQAEGEYVRLHFADGDHLHREPLSALVKRLDPERFVRIHRSYVVDLKSVEAVTRSVTGRYVMRLTTGDQIPVGRSYRAVMRAIYDAG